MKRSLFVIAMTGLFLLSGCGGSGENVSAPEEEQEEIQQENIQPAAVTAAAPAPVQMTAFVSGMGCSDPNCTDASHHHDCPADCADYSHYHNCALDCTEASHHHTETGTHHENSQPTVTTAAPVQTIAFVSGMGCSDPTCTDASHHHDCPADCADYSHYHNCSLDCTEGSHHHKSQHHGSAHH